MSETSVAGKTEQQRVWEEVLSFVDVKRREYEEQDQAHTEALKIRDAVLEVLDEQVDAAQRRREDAWRAWGEALEMLREVGL